MLTQDRIRFSLKPPVHMALGWRDGWTGLSPKEEPLPQSGRCIMRQPSIERVSLNQTTLGQGLAPRQSWSGSQRGVADTASSSQLVCHLCHHDFSEKPLQIHDKVVARSASNPSCHLSHQSREPDRNRVQRQWQVDNLIEQTLMSTGAWCDGTGGARPTIPINSTYRIYQPAYRSHLDTIVQARPD